MTCIVPRSLFMAIAASLVVFGIYLTNYSGEGTTVSKLPVAPSQSLSYELALRNDKPTLIEFYADWCTNCRSLASVLSTLQQEEAINFVFLNVDDSQWTQQMKLYRVKGVPQLTFLNSQGEIVETLVGLIPETTIREVLQRLS